MIWALERIYRILDKISMVSCGSW